MRFAIAWIAACAAALGQNYSTKLDGRPVSAVAAGPDRTAFYVSKDRVYRLAADGSDGGELGRASTESAELTAIGWSNGVVAAAGSIPTERGDRDALLLILVGDAAAREFRFGGSGDDRVARVSIDTAGNVFILGSTDSPDLPVSGGLATNRYSGGVDGFLVRLNRDLQVLSATYLGGAADDYFTGLAVDTSGSTYIASSTNSSEIIANGAQPRIAGVPALISFDAGASWNPPENSPFRATVTSWHFPDANTMFAATLGEGVFRSGDRGRTWQPVSLGLGDLRVTVLAGDPQNTQTIFAAAGAKLYRSVNAGGSWTEVPISATASEVSAIAVHPRDRTVLFAGLRKASGPGCGGLHRSADGGRTWLLQNARMTPTGPSRANLCVSSILIDPVSGTPTILADQTLFRPMETPNEWIAFGDFAGLKSVVADLADPNVWYAVAEGGVYRSADRAATWELLAPQATFAAAARNAVVTERNFENTSVSQPLRSLAVDPLNVNGIYLGFDYVPDLYIAKLSPNLNQVVYSTFLGGSSAESAPSLDVDRDANLFLAATTMSTDLPTTPGAIQPQPDGGTNVLIARFNANFDMNHLTYLGGGSDDRATDIRLGGSGLLFLTGVTSSTGLPTSLSAFQPRFGGGTTDGFLAALQTASWSVAYWTYWGDESADSASALAVDSDGNAIAGGRTGDAAGFLARFGGFTTTRPLGPIRNAASLSVGTLAPGSLAIIEGNDFGPLTNLAVRFGEAEAQILQAEDNRIEVVVPFETPVGSTVIRVSSRNGDMEGRVTVESVSPGMFSANRDGTGVALGQLFRVDESGNLFREPIFECGEAPGSCQAVPIDLGDETDQLFLALRATGIRNGSNVRVTMNGREAEVIEAGALNEIPGTDQVIVRLPRELGVLNQIVTVRIEVTVEGKTANPVTVLIG